MITLKILDSVSSIENKVNEAIAKEINIVLNRNLSTIINKVKLLAATWISNQPEILSLKSNSAGSLAGQFGLYPGQENIAISSIINSVQNSVEIRFKKFTPKLKGGLELNFQPSNFLNLLNLPQGFVTYEKGQLHWLDWLLTKGDSVIVVNYQYNPTSGVGRSGLGNMIEGGFFRVPPQFSGTDDNNFITRALVGPDQEKEIAKIFKDILGG